MRALIRVYSEVSLFTSVRTNGMTSKPVGKSTAKPIAHPFINLRGNPGFQLFIIEVIGACWFHKPYFFCYIRSTLLGADSRMNDLMSGNIVLKPIGFVKTKASGKDVKDRSNISQIVFHQTLTDALDGIEAFSHIFVIFWMHKISNEDRKTKKVHPRGRDDMPLLGVFATRTPHRPNPLGLTLVELLKVEGNVMTVRGLDAFHDTPILDIKPFDHWDMVEDARVPDWWMRLEEERLGHTGSKVV